MFPPLQDLEVHVALLSMRRLGFFHDAGWPSSQLLQVHCFSDAVASRSHLAGEHAVSQNFSISGSMCFFACAVLYRVRTSLVVILKGKEERY